MGRAPWRFVSSTARRALLVAATCLLTVGVAPAVADGPLGLDAGGTVSGVTGAVPPSVGAAAAPATSSTPAVAKVAVDTAGAAPAAAHLAATPAPAGPAGSGGASPDGGGPAAGPQHALEQVAAPATGIAARPVTDAAAPTVERAAQHVDRVARAADPPRQGIDRLARQVTPMVQQVSPLLQQVDPLVRGLTTLVPTERILSGLVRPAPVGGLVESRGVRLPRLGMAKPPAANGDALPGTRHAPRVGTPPPHPADGSGPLPGVGPRGDGPVSAPAGSTTLAPREALHPPLSRSAPATAPGGAGSAGFFFSPFLALLVLVALAAPTLLRRFEPPPAFLRPALLACALERPG
jgi:hypothetical protein